uniref:Uncharacterized protein n=1 Tax=Megaviridae environmental sample TaxID=1737588 RepID=A0A5J6VKM4_9VIRU|nr:MAG: hypothetical protein [Megaviridae environmental sample]
MANKFDKNFRFIYNGSTSDISELFNRIDNMDINELKLFVLQTKLPLYVTDSDGNNLIHKVLLNNDQTKTNTQKLSIIKYLYNENVNPDQPNSDNITPLHLACKFQLESIVDFLLDINCNPNYQDNNGNTCLFYLLSGKISIYNPKIQQSLIPLSKNDTFNSENLLNLKKIIWKFIKNNGDFIESIVNIFESSIGNSLETESLLTDFQKKITDNNLSMNRKSELKLLQELVSINLIKFKKIVKQIWGNISEDPNIDLHYSDALDSWPNNGFPIDINNTKLIKNSDLHMNIKTRVNFIIEEFINKLDRIKSYKIPIDIQTNYDNLYKELLTTMNEINIKPSFDTEDRNEDYENFNAINKANNIINYADNVIDLENHLFIGGTGEIKIVGELLEHSMNDLSLLKVMGTDRINNILDGDTTGSLASVDKITDILHQLIFIKDVGNNSVTLTTSKKESFKLDEFSNFKSFILNFIKKGQEFEEWELEDLLQKFKNDYYILNDMIDKRNQYNRGIWFYSFMTAWYYSQSESNLKGNLPQQFILLAAALINTVDDKNNDKYLDNLQLSISQVCKSYFIDNLICDIPEADRFSSDSLGKIFKKWILFLFSKKLGKVVNFDDYDRDNKALKNISEFLYNFFNDKPSKSDRKKLKDYLKSKNIDNVNILDSELVSLCIMNYYDSIEQSPLLQNVVDTISIIRFYELNKKKNTNQLNEICLQKLRQLYVFSDYFITHRKITDKKFSKILDKKNNNINLIYDLTYSIIPSRTYFNIDYTDKKYDTETLNYIKNKYIEAVHLGLQYSGFLPEVYISIDVKDDNKLQLFNFYYSRINTDSNTQKFKYYNLYDKKTRTDIPFRPPTKYNSEASHINKLNRLFSLQNIVLDGSANISLKQIFEDITNNNNTGVEYYAKIIPFFYPILQSFTQHISFLNSLINYNIPDVLDDMNNVLNEINANVFLDYYLVTPDEKKMYIPKFIYYQLEKGNDIVIFNSNNRMNKSDLFSDNNYKHLGMDPTKELNKYNNYGFFNNRNASYSYNYNDIFLTAPAIINKSYIAEKKFRDSKLPPSLYEHLDIYYKYNKINYIKEYLKDIYDHIDDEDDKLLGKIVKNPDNMLDDENITGQKLFIIAKQIEQIINQFMSNKINIISNKLFKTLLNKKYKDGFFTSAIQRLDVYNLFDKDSIDFDDSLDKKIDIFKKHLTDIDINKKDIAISLYRFSDVIPTNKNIITMINYTDDYSSVNLYKSKYKIDINKNILKTVLKYSNLNINNLENETCIYPIFKSLNHQIIEIFNKGNMEIKNSNTTIDGKNIYEYVTNKYTNHINLMVNNKENYMDQINEFTSSQYKEIEELIFANESFKNNILKNLKTSFDICAYIAIQYVSENMLKLDSGVYNYIKENSMNKHHMSSFKKTEYQNINQFIETSDIDIVVIELKDLKKIELEKVNDKINLLKRKRKNYTDVPDRQKIKYRITELTGKKSTIENTLIRLKRKEFKSIKNDEVSNIKIINRYNKLLEIINNDRTVYIHGWKKLFEDIFKKRAANKNIDLLPLYILNEFELKKIIGNINENKNIDTTLLKNLSKYYKHNEDLLEKYFKKDRYTDDNKLLLFTKDLLVHLTKNIICNGLEIIIKKILYQEIQAMSTDTTIVSIKDIITLRLHNVTEKLYNDDSNNIAERLVINAVKIFKNRSNEENHEDETVEEILTEFFNYLEIQSDPYKISEFTIGILKSEISKYFDTISFKIINNWNVVIENVFMFFINQNRYIQTIKQLF